MKPIPKKQTKKWCGPTKKVFEGLYEMMFHNPNLFKHPSAPTLSGAEWETTCWNAAWIAADLVQEEIDKIREILK